MALHQEFVLMKRQVSHPRQRVTFACEQEQHVQQQVAAQEFVLVPIAQWRNRVSSGNADAFDSNIARHLIAQTKSLCLIRFYNCNDVRGARAFQVIPSNAEGYLVVLGSILHGTRSD